jgi:hypothetical protein
MVHPGGPVNSSRSTPESFVMSGGSGDFVVKDAVEEVRWLGREILDMERILVHGLFACCFLSKRRGFTSGSLFSISTSSRLWRLWVNVETRLSTTSQSSAALHGTSKFTLKAPKIFV